MRGGLIIVSTFISLLILASCGEPRPQPIQYGSDECAYCRMIVTDAEFASQVLNNQGRSFKFDSIECMAAYDITNEEPENIHSKWVPDFHNRGEWLEAENAVYLHSETLRSPMGLFLSSYADRSTAEEMKEEYGGEIIDYNAVKQLVEQEWLSNNGSRQGMRQ